MLPFKSHLIVFAVSLVIGIGAGYSIRDEKARIAELEATKTALQNENLNLIKQIETEHEYQKAASETTKQAQEDLADLESRYADAVNALNDLQLLQLSYDSEDIESLPESSGSTADNSKSSNKCSNADRAKLQKLYEEQLTLARDCDINAIHLNQLIDLYNSIQ